MSLPSDHIDVAEAPAEPNQPKLGLIGWLRWVWRQLTSMRTALFLLLLLAVAAVPGSLVPQHLADPNGVVDYKLQHPTLYKILDSLQVFDTYTSVWFSAIYLLLFVSLIGCVIPRIKHHLDALRAAPPRTPARLQRMAGFRALIAPRGTDAATAIELARSILKSSGYRTVTLQSPHHSVSAERGYLRETGNLVFHCALLGILIAVGIGGGFGYSGQRLVVTGQTFVNSVGGYDAFNPGRFVDKNGLEPYSITLDRLDVAYETSNKNALGQPLDYTAHVTTKKPGEPAQKTTIKVNDPLSIGGTDVYLLANGYAPHITIRNTDGTVAFQDLVPFIPQDSNYTSQGVVKVPDGLAKQLGMIGFFYPTAAKLPTGALTSSYPGLKKPTLTFNVYQGDLGLDTGAPVNVYSLNVDKLTQIAGPGAKADTKGLQLVPGQTVALPGGLGSMTFDGVERYATLDIHHDPTQNWVLLFAICVLGGLLTSLFVPRRRVWVKAVPQADGMLRLEYAGLARGEDPGLDAAIAAVVQKHSALVQGPKT